MTSSGYTTDDQGWKAGVASIEITPDQPLWMAGYASRTHPSNGKLTALWAKALVLEDADGKKVVLVTMDLVGIPKKLSDHVRDQLKSKFQLSRSQIILNTSHTHTGPVLTGALVDIYPIDSEEQQKIDRYTHELGNKIIGVVGKALQHLEPAKLYSDNGVTRFQVNRRNNNEATLNRQAKLNGPNDYAVPVLKVTNNAGRLIAIAFGYACHNTVLSGYKWSGDYAGFAQIELQKKYPGVSAMFFQGCGADQNPLPRRTVTLAKQYGKTLAAAVEQVLSSPMQELSPHLSASYKEIELSLTTPPTKKKLLEMTKKASGYQKRWATRLLQKVEQGESLKTSYPYPIQVWRLGDQTIMALGGEVVINYAIRLKQIFGQSLFVLGYSNDVMSYIPSTKILRQGGYEGAFGQMVYGLPSTWASNIEIRIMSQIVQLAEKTGVPKPVSQLINLE